MSADPILNKYLKGYPNTGVYRPMNLNLYNYVAQNPVGRVDSNGQLDEVGHYYLPIVASYEGGFSKDNSIEVGRASWGPDTDDRSATSTKSIFQSFVGRFFGAKDRNQPTHHVLDGADAASAAKMKADKMQQLATRLKAFAAGDISKLNSTADESLAHSAGDSYVHVQEDGSHYGEGLGHALDGHKPDNAFNNPGLIEYAQDLKDISTQATGNSLEVHDGNGGFSGLLRSVTAEPDKDVQINMIMSYMKNNHGVNIPPHKEAH